MKISREIGGKIVEIELSKVELEQAYLEQENHWDMENVRQHLKGYPFWQNLSDEKFEQAVSDIADNLRVNLDESHSSNDIFWDIEQDAMDDAIEAYIKEHPEYDPELAPAKKEESFFIEDEMNEKDNLAVNEESDLRLLQNNKLQDEQKLLQVLRSFDRNGWKGSSESGPWEIASGGYDLWFELSYNGNPVAQCIDGKLSSNFGYSDDEKQVLFSAITRIYDNLTIEGLPNEKGEAMQSIPKTTAPLKHFIDDANTKKEAAQENSERKESQILTEPASLKR